MNTVEEFEAAIKSLTEERDQLTSHYSDAKELIQRMMKEEEVLREERDRLQSDLAAMGTDLGVMTEDRDRARDAIYWADGQRGEFRERGPKEGAYWWRKELMERAGLKPVSDRLPEGETKCQIE